MWHDRHGHQLTAMLIAILVAALLAPAAVAAQEAETAAGNALTADELAAVVVCPVPATSTDTAPTAPDMDSFPLATVSEAPPTRPVGTWDGTWEPMPPAPIAGRSHAASGYAVWEDRFYVWGGRDADGTILSDGAVFLVEDQAWKALPESSLVPRDHFGFDTDQRGFTIWGGVDTSGQPLDDGARLELGWGKHPKMSWTLLPPAPLTPGPASLSGDVNTTYAVTPGAEPDDPPRFAVLDADSGELDWDDPSSPDVRVHGEMPSPQVPAGIAYEIASAWFAAVLLSYQPDGTAIASWFSDMWPGEWSDPERVPLPATSGCPALEVSAFAWLRAGVDGTPIGLLVSDLERTGWQSIGAPPEGTPTGGALVMGPRHLVVADALLAYDSVAERWLRLPPLPDGARAGVSAAWAFGQLYLWGGRVTDGTVLDTGWVFTPTLPADSYRLRDGHRTGWAGCADVGYDPKLPRAVLRADRDDPALVWFRFDRKRYEATWPDGYTVRFRDGRAAVIGADGTIVARAGDRLQDVDLPWCPSGRSISFAL